MATDKKKVILYQIVVEYKYREESDAMAEKILKRIVKYTQGAFRKNGYRVKMKQGRLK